MNLLIWACFAQVVWPHVSALFHSLSRELFLPPISLRNDSYFGYSITYDQEYKKLIISAPRANNIGTVYDCDVSNKACTPIVTDISRVSNDYENDYWFGATVKSGPDFVLMCAPRYTEKSAYKDHNEFAFNDFGTYGKCYSRTKGRMVKLRSIDMKKKYIDSDKTLEGNMDSFGWSIDVGIDDSVIIGGPGMYHGRALVYQTWRDSPVFMRTSSKTPTFNFGYSVAAGTFINDRLSFAVGSPYGKKGFGTVSFFKKVEWQNELLKSVDTEVVGSMFGAVLCGAIMYKKRSDLLVGAPTFATHSAYNLGAVYIYIAVKVAHPPKFKRRILGKTSGSLFGSAIANLGDINADKREDVAIAAPFENDGKGAVYIYSGADLVSEKTEKTLKYLQKIEPEPAYGLSFGMSLTTLLDYDQNGCKELAIGSPFTDKVVLLRCLAAVTVKTSAHFPNLQDRTRTNKINFEFDVCLSVEYPRLPENITALLLTTVEMSHPDAKLVGKNTKFQTSLATRKSSYCTSVPFILPKEGNYGTEIYFDIKTTQLDSPLERKVFEPSRVILSDSSVLQRQESVWAAECSGNKMCVPNLKLTTDFSFRYTDKVYVIGTSDVESFNISVNNGGEVAYDACVRVRLRGARVLQPPRDCVLDSLVDGDSLLCVPDKPLRNNQKWNTGNITLEMTHLTNLDKQISVETHLYNRCKDAAAEVKTVVTPVKADPSGIVVKGETDIGDVVNMTREDVQENGKKIQHDYTISNNGPTNWAGFSIIVALPVLPYIRYDEKAATLYVSTFNSYTDCALIEELPATKSYSCKIDSLMAKVQTAKILIPMYILPKTLDDILSEHHNVTIHSNVTLKLDENGNIKQSIVTTILLQDATVPLKWIIMAVVIGLIILIIIAFILYKCGFLRRKKKQDLEQLRKSVRRQTILRRSTMPNQQAQAEDRRKNLEQMKEESEGAPAQPCP